MKFKIFFSLVFAIFVLPLSLSGDQKSLRQKMKKAKINDEAVYEVEINSPTGKNKVKMTLKVVAVSITRVKIRKILEWKGQKVVKTVRFSRVRDLVEQMAKMLESSWETVSIDKRISSTPESVTLSEDVKVTKIVEKSIGANVKKTSKESKENTFSCYKVELNAKGKYPKKSGQDLPVNPKPSTMKMTYYLSEEVPIFGWVKAEGGITQKLAKGEVQATIRITLKSYKKIQEK
ncbi:MAG: hypothetical protein D6785_15175 [Planctomycetota bacterium]|nr:MAG: hypothetical protein D6785_15175 [Planctomycetota bacterium]